MFATKNSESSSVLYSQSRLEVEELLAYIYPHGVQHINRDYDDNFRSLLSDDGGRGKRFLEYE